MLLTEGQMKQANHVDEAQKVALAGPSDFS